MLHNRTFHIRRAKPLLGTVVDISLFSDECGEDVLLPLSTGAFQKIADVQKTMSFYEPLSDIGRLNATQPEEELSLSPETVQVLQLACEIYEASRGAFDVMSRSREQFPHASLRFSGTNKVLKTAPALIDLGGIAKGYAVDQAVESLAREGLSGVVNAGGDIRFFGEDTFPLTIRSPHYDGRNTDAGTFANCAVATSVYNNDEGQPRSISVIADTCIVADALTKALAYNPEPIQKELLKRYEADFFELASEPNHAGGLR